MTSVRRFVGVLCVGLLLTAVSALASDIVTLQLIGSSGYTLPQTDQQTYPYTAQVDGAQVITVACDDYYHNSTVNGPPFLAYRTELNTLDVSNTRFGATPNGLQLYQEVAYLANQFSGASQFQQAELNWAIWEMTSAAINQPLTYGFDAGIQADIDALINNAVANYQNGPAPAWTKLVIYTPINSNDQEMIEVVTPEPGTMLLLGSGIVGLWSQRKRII